MPGSEQLVGTQRTCSKSHSNTVVSSRSWAIVKREGLTTCLQNGGFGAPYIHRMVFTSVLSTFPLVFLVPTLFLVPMMFDARLRLYVHAYLPTIPHSITVSTLNFCHTMRIDWSLLHRIRNILEKSIANKFLLRYSGIHKSMIYLWFTTFFKILFNSFIPNDYFVVIRIHVILAPSKVSAQ